MADFKASKVVAALPAILEKDTVYFVKTGDGFDVYVTNGTGDTVAYPLNIPVQLLVGSESYTYQDGLVTKITQDGQDTLIDYNPDKTVNTVTYPTGRIETYTYTGGVLTGMTAIGG